MYHPLYVSRSFRDRIKSSYPAAFKKPKHTRFLEVLLFTPHEEKYAVASSKLIASILGRKGTKNICALAFIEEFEAATDIPLQKEDYDYLKGQARRVYPHFPPEIWQAVREEISVPVSKKADAVLFSDGTKYSTTKHRKLVKQTIDRFYQQLTGDVIVDYFSSIKPCVFNRYKPQIEQVMERINADQTIDENKKELYLRHLHFLNQNPVPLYTRHDSRIYAEGYSWQNLKSEFRTEIFHDCYVFDLQSAQLVIFADSYGCPQIKRHLQSGKTVWQTLGEETGLEVTPDVKAYFKVALYAAMYGAGDKTIREALQELPAEIQEKFLNFSIIVELRETFQKLLQELKTNFYLDTPIGRINWGKGLRPMAVIARISQQIETKIMEAAYTCAAGMRGRVTILSCEHDGFTCRISDTNSHKTVCRRFQEAVRSQASKLGIQIELDVKKSV